MAFESSYLQAMLYIIYWPMLLELWTKGRSLGIFLDLAKTFDTVSVLLLIDKLESVGVRGVKNMFRSYLSNRTQCVKLGHQISDEIPIEYGVPQGRVLGATLFLIYVNGICNMGMEKWKM